MVRFFKNIFHLHKIVQNIPRCREKGWEKGRRNSYRVKLSSEWYRTTTYCCLFIFYSSASSSSHHTLKQPSWASIRVVPFFARFTRFSQRSTAAANINNIYPLIKIQWFRKMKYIQDRRAKKIRLIIFSLMKISFIVRFFPYDFHEIFFGWAHRSTLRLLIPAFAQ